MKQRRRSTFFSFVTMPEFLFRKRGETVGIADAVRQRFNELMAERHLTINALANLSGVTQSTANDFFQRTSSNIGIITLKKLIDGLGISISEFFDTDTFRNLEQELK